MFCLKTISVFAFAVLFPLGAHGQNIYVANSSNGGLVGLVKVESNGTMTAIANTSMAIAFGMARDASGNLFVCESFNGGVSQFAPSNAFAHTYPVGGLSKGYALAFDSNGHLYATNSSAGIFAANSIVKFTSAAGVGATFATGFSDPRGLAFDTSGNLYVANYGNNTVSKVTPGGAVSTFATGLNLPWGLAFDGSGNLFVANYGGKTISKVSPAGVVSTFATLVLKPFDLDFDAQGNLYCTSSSAVYKFKPDGSQITFATGVGSNLLSLVVEPGFVGLDPIDSWRTAQFGADASNPAISGDAADPDHDGVINLLEYAFGSNPVSGAPTPMPAASVTGGLLALTYQQKSGIQDISFDIEISDNLTSWSVTTDYTVVGADYDAATNVTTYQITFPAGTTSQYARVKVTRK